MKFFPAILKWTFAALFVALFCIVFRPFEPWYHWKPLWMWADELNSCEPDDDISVQMDKQQRAADAIRHIGARAVPYALRCCQVTAFAWSKRPTNAIYGWEQKHKISAMENSRVESSHSQSWQIFQIIGSNGKSAIPSLIKLLGNSDRDVAGTASGDLEFIGTDSIAPLITALTNQNVLVRENAARALGGIGESLMEYTQIKEPNGGTGIKVGPIKKEFRPQIQSVIVALMPHLKEQNHRVRSGAAFALMQCDAPPSIIPALIAALKKETNDPKGFMDSGVFYAIGHYKTNATAAVPLLLKIVQSQRMTTPRDAALTALRQIDPAAAKPFLDRWKASLTNGLFNSSNPPSKHLQSQNTQTNSSSP